MILLELSLCFICALYNAIALTQNFLFPFIASQSSANIFQANFNIGGNRSWNSKMKSFRASPRFIDGCSNLLWNFRGIKLMTRNRIFQSGYLRKGIFKKINLVSYIVYSAGAVRTVISVRDKILNLNIEVIWRIIYSIAPIMKYHLFKWIPLFSVYIWQSALKPSNC